MVDFKSFLDTTVLEEKKPVTYKCLARNLNINVNLAKQALYQYATSEPKVTVIYCITGTLEKNATSIQLVESNKLEDTKQRFLQISSIHVYSIIPYQPKDLSVLAIANKDIVNTSREDRIRNGLIRNDRIEIRTTNLKSTTIKPTVNNQSSTNSKQQNKTTTTTLNGSTKPHSKVSKSTPVKRKGTLSFESMGSKSKKPAIETSDTLKETPKSQPEIKKRVIRSIQESDEDEDEDEESLDARLARSATIQVDDIFSDDEDMENDSKSTTSVKKNEKETSPDMDIDIDIDNDNDHVKKDTKSSALSDENEDHEVTPGKTKRKVEKKKTYKNERGFLVTETVWEWEEVDAETENKNKDTIKSPLSSSSLQQSKSTKKPTNNKKTEQKSLLSFWGKK